jgi:uncharacterized protein (TIGR02145 family)
MKRQVKNSIIVILLFGTAIYLPSCKQEETLQSSPVVATTNVSDITQTTALIEGTVTANGGIEIMIIGVCWSTSPNPTISSHKTSNVTGSGSFTSSITGLTANTKYNVRAYATNIAGTSYGNEFTFTTNDIVIEASKIIFNPSLTYGAISDIDSNNYKTIQIGNQIWMAENLKTTRLNDGTLIPNVKESKEWGNLKTPGYSWYDNDASAYLADYGLLYNWFTVNTNKLCPSGWHVPSGTEWSTLTTYLGGGSIACGKMMEAGTAHWLNSNTGSTNSSGFTGLPGGSRYGDDVFLGYIVYSFFDLGYTGYWWLSSEFGGTDYASIANIFSREDSNLTGIDQHFKNNSASVRCVKTN